MKPKNILRSESGNIVLIILSLLAVAGAAMMAMLTLTDTTANVSHTFYSRQKSFNVSESTRAITIALIQTYLTTHPQPDSAEMTDLLKSQLLFLKDWGFVAQNIQVTFLTTPAAMAIPTGTFQGMIAPQTTVSFGYDIISLATGEGQTQTRLDATVNVSQISLFQFMYFMDLAYADWAPTRLMTVGGRVHVNGDVCISGVNGLTFNKITAAGRIMHGTDTRCFAPSSGGANVFVKDATSTPQQLTLSADYGCKNCASTGMDWQAYSMAKWGGNLKDSANGVHKLNLPLAGSTVAQIGADGDSVWQGRSNTKSSRFIVDPMRPEDTADVSKQKLSYNAQIRIIDGVWYIADPAKNTWPGIPIWSDHPGSFIDPQFPTLKVGQDDIRADWQLRGYPWPANDIPRGFSYYKYDTTNKTLYNDASGVISYGTLFRSIASGSPQWTPGHWVDKTASTAISMDPTVLCATTPATPEIQDALKLTKCLSGGGVRATGLLNATRSGINDPHIFSATVVPFGYSQKLSQVLPTNFDVAAFQQALSNKNPGELGSYFGANGFLKKPFTGIVYITSTWTNPNTYPNDLPGNSERGYTPEGIAKSWPFQGIDLSSGTLRNQDANQPKISSSRQQRALPFPLCSASLQNQPFNGPTSPGPFKIPDCSSYPGSFAAYPSVVRIINGRNLDQKSIGTQGLSIASNLPVYVVGAYNTNSDPTSNVPTAWTSSLIAGDVVTFLSDAWDDANSQWYSDPTTVNRTASSTAYNTALIMGWARSSVSPSTGVPASGIPILMENWGGYTLNYTGAISVAYYPVYYRQGPVFFYVNSNNYSYSAGTRTINFDSHFTSAAGQPPGTPIFYISSVINWKTQ